MKRDKKAWDYDIPRGKRLEIEDELRRNREKLDNNEKGMVTIVSFKMIKDIFKWLSGRIKNK
jgi:hypothetical protein|tara:strand:- start:21543 stop:21728 length:186 start_codon:yes stop_codon:yes gene_type:complete